MILFSTVFSASGSLVDVDATLFIQLGVFLIMLLLLRSLLFRPVIRLIEARREATDGTLTAAVDLEREAAALEESVREKLDAVRKRTLEKREEILQASLRTEQSLMTEARSAAHAKVREMKQRAESQLSEVKGKLHAETSAFASKVASKMLGRPL